MKAKKILPVLLAVALVFSAVGCNTSETPSEPTGSSGTTTTAMTPGTYTASLRGYGSEVVVETTVDETSITDVKVVSHDESTGIGTYAIERLPGEIVENQSVAVDAVSGATATSNAILFSVRDCLTQAGADLAAFSVEPAAPTPTDVALEADIVVVGAGGAGLTAALEALDNGKSVIVVEKMDTPGGNTIRSSGAFNVAGSQEQIDANKGNVSVEEFIEYTMTGGHDINNPDLVRYMVENSAAMVDWLRSEDFNVTIGETYGSYTVDGLAAGLVLGLLDRVEEKGGQVMFTTKATEITMTDGKATGIKAIGADGGNVTITAGAVILATGGFGGDLAMCAELDPALEGYVTDNNPGITGDGIKMAQAIGADVVDMNEIQTHPTIIQATGTMVTEGARNSGGILLNVEGKRFTNECTYRDVVSNAILAQPEQKAYILINQEILDGNGNIAGYYKIGAITKCENAEEIANYIGHDVTADTITSELAKWSECVANQNDPEFGSEFQWLRNLDVGPWYIAEIAPGIHHTMGGVKINTNAEVISTEGAVIPGLYACGEVTGGVHGGNRVGGNAILDCLVFGHTAADQACAYLG